MAKFNVTVQPRETGAKPFTLEVNGNDIRSQEDAEAHATKHSSDRYTVVSAKPAEVHADDHSA